MWAGKRATFDKNDPKLKALLGGAFSMIDALASLRNGMVDDLVAQAFKTSEACPNPDVELTVDALARKPRQDMFDDIPRAAEVEVVTDDEVAHKVRVLTTPHKKQKLPVHVDVDSLSLLAMRPLAHSDDAQDYIPEMKYEHVSATDMRYVRPTGMRTIASGS